MTAENDEAVSALAVAERELYQWATGQRSFMNEMMNFEKPDDFGQIGDRQLTLVRIAQRDAAELEVARQKVLALRLLASAGEVRS